MDLLKRYWVAIFIFILVGLIYFSNPLSYLKRIVKEDIKTSQSTIDSLNNVIRNIEPSKEYLFKIDSLKLELERVKSINYEKVRYIYINSSFDDKFELLSNRISKDTL